MHDPGHGRTTQVAANGLMSNDGTAARQFHIGAGVVHD